MNKEIRCPYCNADLTGRETMYRSVILDDNTFGIEDGKIILCNDDMLAPPQPMHGDFICGNCNEDIDDYIYDLIDEDVLYE